MSNLDDIGYNLVLDDSGFKVTANATAAQLKALEAQFASTGQAVKAIEQKVNSVGVSFHQWVTAIGSVKFALMDMSTVFLSLPKSIIETSGEIEHLQTTLRGLSTAGTDAGRAMDSVLGTKFILALEQEVPFRLSALTDTFIKLKSGGIDPMNGSMTSLLNEVAKFGGTSENLKSATLAIQQMAGKGVVSLQELRQQLGQAVPGAAQAMATGMGMSMGDLTKAITKGTVSSEMAIKKMLAVFNIDSLGAAREQMKTFEGSMEKLNTRWDLFKLDVGKAGFFDTVKSELNEFIDLFNDPRAHEFAVDLGKQLTEVAIALRNGLTTLAEWGPQLLIVGKALAGAFAVTSLAGVFNSIIGTVKSTTEAFREYGANAVISQNAVKASTLSLTEQILAADAKRIASMVSEREISMEITNQRIAANEALIASEQASINAVAAMRAEAVAVELAQNEVILRAKKAELAELTAAQLAYQVQMRAMQAAGTVGSDAQALADLKSRIAYMNEAAVASQAEVTALSKRSNTLRSMAQEERGVIGSTNDRIASIASSNESLRASNALHTEAINGMSGMTRASAALKAGMIGLGAAFNAVGGWVTLLSVAVVAGISVWNKYRDSAAEAVKTAAAAASLRMAIEKGSAGKEDLDRADRDIKNKQDELTALTARIKTAKGTKTGERNLDGTVDQGEDPVALQAQYDAKVKLLDIAVKTRAEGAAQVAQNQALINSSQYGGKYEKELAATENSIASVVGKENADLKAAYDERIKNVNTQAPEYKAIQQKYADDLKALKVKQTNDEITALKTQQAAVDAQIRKGFSGPDADARMVAAAKASKNLGDMITSAQGNVDALNAQNVFVAPKDKAAARVHAPTDELANALGQIETQLERAKAKLEQIKTGATQYDDIRRGVQAEVAAMLDNGQLDYITHGKNGGKSTPEANDPRVLQLIDEKTSIAIVKDATQQLESIGKQIAPAQTKLKESMDLLLAGDYTTKPGAASEKANAALDKMTAKSLAASAALSEVDKQKQKVLLTAATQDLVDYTRTLGGGNDAAAASLLTNQRDQLAEQNRIAKAAWEAADKEKLDGVIANGGNVDAELAVINKRRATDAAVQAKKLETPLTQLADHWKDTTARMQEASTGWADSTVNSLVNVVKTGKLNFSSLVDQITTDLLKISLQKSVGSGLQVAFDGLTKGFGNLIGGNGKDEQSNPLPGTLAGAGSSILDFLKSPIESVTSVFNKLTGKGTDLTASLTDNAKNLVLGTTTNTTAQSSVMTLGNAALFAANALASVGGGSGASGLGGLFGSLGSAVLGGGSAGTAGVGSNSYGFTMPTTTAFANGGIMSEFGPLALRKYANGGVADSPQVAVYGEGSMKEAFVPLPDGRSIPVTMTGGSGGYSAGGAPASVTVNVINQTGQQVSAQQGSPRFDGRQMILDVVLSAAQSPGAFRDGMKQATR